MFTHSKLLFEISIHFYTVVMEEQATKNCQILKQHDCFLEHGTLYVTGLILDVEGGKIIINLKYQCEGNLVCGRDSCCSRFSWHVVECMEGSTEVRWLDQ